jgi:hypothetical protein
MDRELVRTNAATVRLRRLGRVARRRMRIDGDALRNGSHTNGQLTVQIRGLGASAAGVPESFTWQADRPIALLIVRSGIDGDDVAFITGPAIAGEGRSAGVGDGSGIRYVAFCYDDKIEKRPGSDDTGPRARPGFDIRAAFGRLNRAGSTA